MATQHAVLAAALLAANTAEAWTLNALLQLPLERLMQLRVTEQRTAKDTLAPDARTGLGSMQGSDRAA